MSRFWKCLFYVLLLTSLSGCSQTQATEPPTPESHGPVWAYGTEVKGDAWFETREGTAYYQGIYPYWPRSTDGTWVNPRIKDPELSLAAAQERATILFNAREYANTASTSHEWISRYIHMLESNRELVESYEVGPDHITVRFVDSNVLYGIPIPHISRQTRESTPQGDADSTREEEVQRFWKRYNEGCWICWGSDYFTVVHPNWQAKMTAAIDSVNALIDSGLTGEAFDQAVERIDKGNTALEESNFLRDLINNQRRR